MLGRIDHMRRECEQCRIGYAQLQEMGIVFQQAEKEALALAHGLPLTAYHNITFDEWCRVRGES